MPQIYDYREIIEQEQLEEAHEVAFEFKSERMDPRRPILAWEQSVNIKRRNNLVRKTRLINKGKDAGNWKEKMFIILKYVIRF